ncbi:MAG TPA: DUF1501 domain-containing protein [Chthoniobacteraceae bacterium]|nr:DUF1501 domain-containing protein [Chthoniobacteraceae bacterium]
MNFDPAAFALSVNRRSFLSQSAYGLGGLALASLLGRNSNAAIPQRGDDGKWRGIIREPHFPVRAKRIIHLCMAGGPSQFETFDFKPELKRLNGQAFPESFTKGQQLAQLQGAELKARGPFTEFQKHGASGQEMSSLFPHIATIADDIAIIRSMQTEQINHDPAHAFMNTGSIVKGRPSWGSWMLYGLGAETENLPGFVVLTSQGKAGLQPISARQWSSGFLPSKFQGVHFQSKGEAVHYVGNPEGVCQSTQRQVVEEVNRLNGMLAEERFDPEIATRIAQYEMAFQMQTSVPELTDWSKESAETLGHYGIKTPGDGTFASNCLLARRLAERGVRFIQLYHRAWDHHGDIEKNMPVAAKDVDQASAALIKDLKQRGLLDDTLVLWGGEFGRTPMGQGSGRDHHILSFSVFLAGGGIRPGVTYGDTDELGYRAVRDVVSVHDLHATMLHLSGIDHKRLTYRFQGRDFRLTDVHGKLVKGVIA